MKCVHLKQKVIFLKTGENQNEYGETKNDEIEVCRAWVQIIPLKGNESLINKEVKTEVSHKVRMRFCPRITHDMFFKYKERKFEIESVVNAYEANKELIIMAKEVF